MPAIRAYEEEDALERRGLARLGFSNIGRSSVSISHRGHSKGVDAMDPNLLRNKTYIHAGRSSDGRRESDNDSYQLEDLADGNPAKVHVTNGFAIHHEQV